MPGERYSILVSLHVPGINLLYYFYIDLKKKKKKVNVNGLLSAELEFYLFIFLKRNADCVLHFFFLLQNVHISCWPTMHP